MTPLSLRNANIQGLTFPTGHNFITTTVFFILDSFILLNVHENLVFELQNCGNLICSHTISPDPHFYIVFRYLGNISFNVIISNGLLIYLVSDFHTRAQKNIRPTEERKNVLYLFLIEDFLRNFFLSLLGTRKLPRFFNRMCSFEIFVHILVSRTENTLVLTKNLKRIRSIH